MPLIEDIQSDFRAGIAGQATPPGLTAPDPSEVDRRFAVYRNNVMVSLTNALRQRYPVIERLVGEEFAKAMFGVFVREQPPQSRLMMEYGGGMAEFIEAFPPAASLPYLPDVARLEYARGLAYHAADAAPVEVETLAAAAGGDPGGFGLYLHPSVQLVTSEYPVFTIWASNQPGNTAGPIRDWVAQSALVARTGHTIVTEFLQPADAQFVAALRDGASFASAAGSGMGADPDFDPAQILGRLLQGQMITAVRNLTDAGDAA